MFPRKLDEVRCRSIRLEGRNRRQGCNAWHIRDLTTSALGQGRKLKTPSVSIASLQIEVGASGA